jgi:PAS domain S-box-containing protein
MNRYILPDHPGKAGNLGYHNFGEVAMNTDTYRTTKPSAYRDAFAAEDAWQLFKLAVERDHAVFFDWNLFTNEIYFSHSWQHLLGYDEAEQLQRKDDWTQLLHPQERDQVLSTIQSFLTRTLAECVLEYRVRHRDGSYRWIRSSGTLLEDAMHHGVHLGGWHLDLTEARLAAERLEQQVQIIALYTDFALALARVVSVQILLQHCVDLLLAHLPVGWGGIWIWEPDRLGLVPQARATQLASMQGRERSCPVGAHTAAQIAHDSSPVVSLTAPTDPRLTAPERVWAAQEGMNVFAGYPLCTPEEEGVEVVGVLALFAAEPLPDVFLSTLEDFSLALAVAIRRRRSE